MSTAQKLMNDYAHVFTLFLPVYDSLRKDGLKKESNRSLENFEEIYDTLDTVFDTREAYVDFLDAYRDFIRESLPIVLDLKEGRSDWLIGDLGLHPIVQSDLAKLRNMITMAIWVRRAGRKWRGAYHASVKKEAAHVVA